MRNLKNGELYAKKRTSLGLVTFAIATPLILITPEVLAQQATAVQPNARETITVYAPFVVHRANMQRKAGEQLELISVNRAVSFHDLNLKEAADQKTLETRVNQAAQDACKELDKRFPKNVYIPVPANQDCVANATNEAMLVVTQLIAAANMS